MDANLFKIKLLFKKVRVLTNEHGVRKILFLLISRIVRITLVMVSLPVVPLLRISNRIYPVKLVNIRSKEIGHFVADTEYYLRRTSLKANPVFLLGYFGGVISNKQWAKMVKRQFLVNGCFRYLAVANRLFSGAEKYEFELSDGEGGFRGQFGIVPHTIPQIRFLDDENQGGWDYLDSCGIREQDNYICLIVRDSGYKKVLDSRRDWTYHSYRNSKLESYKKAALELAEQGYWVFRMGKAVEDLFNVEHPKVIDYAQSNERSDFLDIWLMANCYFCITTGTGLDGIAGQFNRPSVYVNLLPLNHAPLYKHSVTVPKKLFWEAKGKLLTVEEYMDNCHTSTKDYERAGIAIVDLESIEISDAVKEMEKSLKNEDYLDEEKLLKQERALTQIFDCDRKNTTRYQFFRHPKSKIGSVFLDTYWDSLGL